MQPLHGSHQLSDRGVLSAGATWASKWVRADIWSARRPEILYEGYGDVFTKGNFLTHDVVIVVHLRSSYARSRSSVDILRRFHFSYCRLVWGTFNERYLTSSKFNFSINTANRSDVEICKPNAIDRFEGEIICIQKDSFVDSTSRSYALDNGWQNV